MANIQLVNKPNSKKKEEKNNKIKINEQKKNPQAINDHNDGIMWPRRNLLSRYIYRPTAKTTSYLWQLRVLLYLPTYLSTHSPIIFRKILVRNIYTHIYLYFCILFLFYLALFIQFNQFSVDLILFNI